MRPATAAYTRRRPEDTVLHRLVREHYATFVAHTEATYAAPVPRYVTEAFERYLACGDFSRGFVRCHCDVCRHDVLVAFSCKQRGLCPSCGTRRMCDEAAYITDRILPNAPIRQWVLSLPFELRGLAATKPDVLTALGRVFNIGAEEIARATKRLAGVPGAETGAVSFPQRFGGSLNLHVHFHTLAVDGVFERDGEDRGRVHEAPPPARAEVADVVRRVHDSALRWLRRHGYIDERPAEERSNAPAVDAPLDGLARVALAGGAFLGRPSGPQRPSDEIERKERRFSASLDGFDVHCAVRIAAADDEGRERLLRYCARPPFALERIEEMKDGRVAYLMKAPRRGSTHRVMTPVEFLGRLAILVPPPYYPLVRYHGVFAARSSWRALVTPKPPPGATWPKKSKPCPAAPPTTPPLASAPSNPAPVRPSSNPLPALPAMPASPSSQSPPGTAPSAAHALPTAEGDPTTITIRHWNRILDGALFASSSRVDWAVLMQRTFGFDALKCPKCDRRCASSRPSPSPST